MASIYTYTYIHEYTYTCEYMYDVYIHMRFYTGLVTSTVRLVDVPSDCEMLSVYASLDGLRLNVGEDETVIWQENQLSMR